MRYQEEVDYWNAAAKDPDVDVKYICDIDTDACLEELGVFEGKVLEIGCGVGRLLRDGYYGIDVSSEMLKIAAKRRPSCKLFLTTGDIPFGDFDTVYSMLVFQHIKPNQVFNYIKEAHRVLRPDGMLKFQYCEGTEREPFSNHYTQEEMENWLFAAGFKRIEWQDSKLNPIWRWVTAWK